MKIGRIDEDAEQIRLFEEAHRLSEKMVLIGGIAQNYGHYYSQILDEFDSDVDNLIDDINKFRKDVRDFHKEFDPEYEDRYGGEDF